MRRHAITDAEIDLPSVRLTWRILKGGASPLSQPRISWRRHSCGEDAEQTRDGRTSNTQCPRHISIRRAGHSQSTPAFSLGQEAIPVRVRVWFSHCPQDA